MPEPLSASPWELRSGARVLPDGGVEFRVWAPRVHSLSVHVLQRETPIISMNRCAAGEYSAVIPDVGAGMDYLFVPDEGKARPDPVSRWQPAGVHGPSRVLDPRAFAWSDQDWRGLPLRKLIIYELHTGTFTSEGTFDAIIPKLPYLRELGVTAIELMPVAEFPGARNWGYDGACLYAPHSAYGGPMGLKRLVDACHREELAVVLDVVYNHFGPEGNYLGELAPCFTARHRSPWGDAVNFDGKDSDGVRRFFLDNALYWLTEFHVDALRLDAVHEIYDFSARHFLDELTEAFHRQAASLGRDAWIIAESDLNDVRLLKSRQHCGYGVDAQWHDDFHHSLHTVFTADRLGYLSDFGTLDDLGKSICDGFVYDGKYSRYRRRKHGSSSKECAGERFVVYIQNHDQIANACLGDRLSACLSVEQQKLASAVVLCSPFIPMIFMGQEYGELAPFLFFTSYGDADVAEAVRRGRRTEYEAFYSTRSFPDPQAEGTFEMSRLNWSLQERSPHTGILRFHRRLIELRRRHDCLANCRKDLTSTDQSEQSRWLVMERRDPSGSLALLVCNFSSCWQEIPVVFADNDWQLALWSGDPTFGAGSNEPQPPRLLKKDGGGPIRLQAAAHAALLYLYLPPSR